MAFLAHMWSLSKLCMWAFHVSTTLGWEQGDALGSCTSRGREHCRQPHLALRMPNTHLGSPFSESEGVASMKTTPTEQCGLLQSPLRTDLMLYNFVCAITCKLSNSVIPLQYWCMLDESGTLQKLHFHLKFLYMLS